MMNEAEQSDARVVATKSTNKAQRTAAESMEPRRAAKGNTRQRTTSRTLSRTDVSPGLERVRQGAQANEKTRFTALLHHVTVDLLRQSYFALQRDAAAGRDQVTWREYGADLESRIVDLHARLHRGAYRAQPSRRQYIPKPDGRKRPLGIASLEDKIVQRAVVDVLNAIYEADFLGFSYGFRPGRSQHDALDALAAVLYCRDVLWVLDADIEAFFDTVDHERLIELMEKRIGDRRILRLIRKWLKAGIEEADGTIVPTTQGVPQGAVISPLLANIYLHYAFDLWAHWWRRHHAKARVNIIRYADDIICCFAYDNEAQTFLAAMRERLEGYSLKLHPEKTRLLLFGPKAREICKRDGGGKPGTFNFLGFTHLCGRKRNGQYLLMRKTRSDRMRMRLKTIKEGLRSMINESIAEQGKWLQQVVRGYFNYHAVPTNSRALKAFRYHVVNLWRRTLRRRSQHDCTTWEKIARLEQQWLPKVRILHDWPNHRFYVKYPRREPSARIAPARIWAGGVQQCASLP